MQHKRENGLLKSGRGGDVGTAHVCSGVAVHVAPVKGGSDGTTTMSGELDASSTL